jgi:hypothetical protein
MISSLSLFNAEALYLKAHVAVSHMRVAQYFDIVGKTELNTVVLDLKNSSQ